MPPLLIVPLALILPVTSSFSVGDTFPIATLPLLGEIKVLPSSRLIMIALWGVVVPIDLPFKTKQSVFPKLPPVRVSNLKIPPTLLVVMPDKVSSWGTLIP